MGCSAIPGIAGRAGLALDTANPHWSSKASNDIRSARGADRCQIAALRRLGACRGSERDRLRCNDRGLVRSHRVRVSHFAMALRTRRLLQWLGARHGANTLAWL